MAVLFITLFIVVIDQTTKFLIKGGSLPFLNVHIEGMSYGESINVIGDFFKLTFVENPGLAFGIDVNHSLKFFLSLFTLIASIGILYYLWRSRDQKLIVRIALASILGGAIGNLIDRTFYGVFYGYAPLFYGHVVDFFNVDFFDFNIFGRTYERWPIFNIADSSVTIGVLLLIIFHRTAIESKEKELHAVPQLETEPMMLLDDDSSVEKINESAIKETINDGEVSNRKENTD